MSNYTEADYRRIYADLEKQEQESIKAYNTWLMQMKMAINNYNVALTDSGLDSKFPLIEATTDEEIEALDMDFIKQVYSSIMEFRENTKETIEVALGLQDKQEESPKEDFVTDDFFGDFNLDDVGNPLEY